MHGLPFVLSLDRKVGAGRWGSELIADARGIGDGSPSPPVPPSGNTLIPILTRPTALLNSVPSVCVVARKVSLITSNQVLISANPLNRRNQISPIFYRNKR